MLYRTKPRSPPTLRVGRQCLTGLSAARLSSAASMAALESVEVTEEATTVESEDVNVEVANDGEEA